MNAVASIFPVPKVYSVPVERIVALYTLGMLPLLPTAIDGYNRRHRERQPLLAHLAPLQWWLTPSDVKPTAVMALIGPRYDYGYNADVLEIVHLAGKPLGVVRLVRAARYLASMYQVPLSGEIDVQNDRMRRYIATLGSAEKKVAIPERQRWTIALDDLLEGMP